jgi:RNA binding activity-knot of a chromodomain
MTASQQDVSNHNEENKGNEDCKSSGVVTLQKPLQINDRCHVSWRGGNEYLPAVIIERRPTRGGNKHKRRREVDADIETLPPDYVDYYVHYINHDRRLDE